MIHHKKCKVAMQDLLFFFENLLLLNSTLFPTVSLHHDEISSAAAKQRLSLCLSTHHGTALFLKSDPACGEICTLTHPFEEVGCFHMPESFQ